MLTHLLYIVIALTAHRVELFKSRKSDIAVNMPNQLLLTCWLNSLLFIWRRFPLNSSSLVVIQIAPHLSYLTLHVDSNPISASVFLQIFKFGNTSLSFITLSFQLPQGSLSAIINSSEVVAIKPTRRAHHQIDSKRLSPLIALLRNPV